MPAVARLFPVVLLLVAACTSGGATFTTPRPAASDMPSVAAGTKCDPEDYTRRSRADQRAIDSAFSAEPRQEEIKVLLRAPREIARDRVAAAMLACDIPISSTGDEVIEARYGAEASLIEYYYLVTRAVVVSINDSTSLVRLSGQETSAAGTLPISNKNHGRSLRSWIALRNVAKQLRADPTLRADVESSTPLSLVYTR